MLAVGGPHEGGVVVPEVLPGEQLGAVGEDDVVSGEAFFGGGRGGDEEDRAGAEAEGEDRAVGFGEGG